MKKEVRIGFFGSPPLAAACLENLIHNFPVHLVITQPDREGGRGRNLSETPVSSIAGQADITVLKPFALDREILTYLEALKINLIVVVAYGKILPDYLLHFPQYGSVNLHASLLPRHRGASPIESAILKGDRVTGMTLQRMERRMDAGDILAKEQIPVKDDMTAEDLLECFIEMAPDFLTQSIRDYLAGVLEPVKQDESEATYCAKIEKDDGYIDWCETADLILKKIRAFSLWPVAFTKLDGKLLRIFRARISQKTVDEGDVPGTVVVCDRTEGIIVQTGHGIIGIMELQLENRKRMSHWEFMNGYRELEGKLLGGERMS